MGFQCLASLSSRRGPHRGCTRRRRRRRRGPSFHALGPSPRPGRSSPRTPDPRRWPDPRRPHAATSPAAAGTAPARPAHGRLRAWACGADATSPERLPALPRPGTPPSVTRPRRSSRHTTDGCRPRRSAMSSQRTPSDLNVSIRARSNALSRAAILDTSTGGCSVARPAIMTDRSQPPVEFALP